MLVCGQAGWLGAAVDGVDLVLVQLCVPCGWAGFLGLVLCTGLCPAACTSGNANRPQGLSIALAKGVLCPMLFLPLT